MTALQNKTILVTGAGGYLAHSLIGKLKGRGCHLVRASRKAGLAPVEGFSGVTDHCGDLCDEGFCRTVMKGVDCIFHLAGQTSVYVANDNPGQDWNANVRPMLNLLESAREHGGRPVVVFAGTSTQVGIPENLPVDERFRDQPVTVYDIHKLTCEHYLMHYSREGFVRGVSLRLTNVYGPGPASSSRDRGVLNIMARKALRGEPLTVYGDGAAIRDYVYVEDVADAFVLSAEKIEATDGQYYVLGSGTGLSLKDAIQTVADRAGALFMKKTELEHVAPPTGMSCIEDRNFIANVEAFSRATGWNPSIGFVQGVDATLRYMSKAGSN